MRAIRLHGPEDVRVENAPAPEPADDELLLHMRSVGLCGSDRHQFLDGSTDDSGFSEPFIPGHEIAAAITEESAERAGLAPGTLVAVDPAQPCTRCEWCQRGHHNLCPHVRFKGIPGHDGGLAEYLVAPPTSIYPVPDSFDADMAALLEPLGVAIHAVGLADLKPMTTIAILGAGPIGLLLLQVAQQAGAGSTCVIDPLAYRTEAASALGAQAVATAHEAIDAWTDGRGVDVVLEATNSPIGLQHAVTSVRIGGRIVLVGIPRTDRFAMTASTARRKGLTIKYARRMGHVYPQAIRMVEQEKVALAPLVTHRFPLDKAPEAFALQAEYQDGVIKPVIYQAADA